MIKHTLGGIVVIHGGGQCAGSSQNVIHFFEQLEKQGFQGNMGFCEYSFAGLVSEKSFHQ